MSDARSGSRQTTARDALEGAQRDAVERVLVFWDGGFSTLPLPPRGSVLVGRGDGCNLRVDDPSVSRKHATIIVDGTGVRIVDLGSANGTRVRGVRVEPSTPIPLSPDTQVELGSSILLIQRGVLGGAPLGQPVVTARAVPASAASESAAPDEAMQQVRRLVAMVAQGSINVLITGETGTGKEILARSLHAQSSRATAPFIGINCAALPDPLFESELFGYERGAFTGATQSKAGLLESAAGGTVFLDEIGELPLAGQAKLLRALEQREVTRVGGLQPRAIDVRFVAATNRRLEERVAAGEFREDLFYRLNAVTVSIPPLRERKAEILPLAESFLSEARAALHRQDVSLDATARESLLRHGWPGNVRQLRNVMERAALLCTGASVTASDLGLSVPAAGPTIPPSAAAGLDARDLTGELETLERARIERALDDAGGNQTRAAELLGITRRILGRRLERYGIAARRSKP